MAGRMALVLLLLALLSPSYGYVFECLDKCECDTKDEVIHCHNGERTALHLPEGERLRGFHAIGITYNKIRRLPDEDMIKAKFPDLLAIDVERNPDFDCSSLVEYAQIKIISDCFKNASDLSAIPPILRPSQKCDIACVAEKHYRDLHRYVLKLWEIIKEKYNNFNKDETLRDLKKFFMDTVQKINQSVSSTVNKHLEEWADHPKNVKPDDQLDPTPTDPTVDVY